MGQVLELSPWNAYTTPFSIREHRPARVCLPYGVDDLDCSSAHQLVHLVVQNIIAPCRHQAP